jgi:hypothetical protein
MAHYRAYILNREGRIMEAVNLDCADDVAATESAKRLDDGHDVELWKDTRVVSRLARGCTQMGSPN